MVRSAFLHWVPELLQLCKLLHVAKLLALDVSLFLKALDLV